MKIRHPAARVASLAFLSCSVCGSTRAEDALQPTMRMGPFEFCSSGPGGSGCVRFQGYIYVGRRPAGAVAPAAEQAAPAVNPSLGGGRLYIHVEGADSR